MIVIGLCLPILMAHLKNLTFMKTVFLRFCPWLLILVSEQLIKHLPLRLSLQHRVCSARHGALLKMTAYIYIKVVLRALLIQVMNLILNTTLVKLQKRWA